MSLVTLADAQARAGAAVTQAMIDGVEAELANDIGPLTGERTEKFYLERLRWPSLIDGVYLSRRTTTVVVRTDGVLLVAETDYRLTHGYILDLIDTGWQGDVLTATYTPNDTTLVKEVIYDLLTFRVIPSNMQSVRIGQYSETYFPADGAPVWNAALAKVSPAAGLGLTSPYRYRANSLYRSHITTP